MQWWNEKQKENLRNLNAADVLYGFKQESNKQFALNSLFTRSEISYIYFKNWKKK